MEFLFLCVVIFLFVLADRARGRESAVFRITGVISVIGGDGSSPPEPPS